MPSPLATFISGNLIPDEIFPSVKVLGQRLTPSVEVVRGVKFLILTFALITFCRAYVREAHMEIDENIDLDDFKEVSSDKTSDSMSTHEPSEERLIRRSRSSLSLSRR